MAVAFLCLTCSQPVAYAVYLTEWYGSVPVLGYTVNNYPLPAAALSCVAGEARVFCVGGLNGTSQTMSSAFTAPVSKLGVGPWTRFADYPTKVAGQACVAYSGYVYCVGGLQAGSTPSSNSQITSASYFAPLNASGVGNWTHTADYPFGVYDQSCTTLQDNIYCVGGIASNSTTVSAVEYARLSPSGIAGWRAAHSYPIDIAAEACSGYSTRLYCIGGLNATSIAIDSVYYASFNGTAFNWAAETAYPTAVAGQSCIVQYPGLYCVGGLNATSLATRSVFFSYLNDAHLNWIGSAAYPVDVQSQSCVLYSSRVYCIGGFDSLQVLGSVFFSSIGPAQGALGENNSTTSTASATSTSTASSATTIAASSAGAISPYALALDLVLAATATASVIIISYWAPRRRPAV